MPKINHKLYCWLSVLFSLLFLLCLALAAIFSKKQYASIIFSGISGFFAGVVASTLVAWLLDISANKREIERYKYITENFFEDLDTAFTTLFEKYVRYVALLPDSPLLVNRATLPTACEAHLKYLQNYMVDNKAEAYKKLQTEEKLSVVHEIIPKIENLISCIDDVLNSRLMIYEGNYMPAVDKHNLVEIRQECENIITADRYDEPGFTLDNFISTIKYIHAMARELRINGLNEYDKTYFAMYKQKLV